MTERIETIKEKLQPDEAVLITDFADRFYLTGFNSSDGFVFITKDNACLLVDFRYFEMAKTAVSRLEVILLKNTFEQLNRLISDNNVKTVYTVCDKITLSKFLLYKDKLSATLSDDNKFGMLLKALRSVKNDSEILSIKRAQKITDETFEYILGKIGVGKTEREIALEMEFFLREKGSEGVSFDFIVVSGKNSSLPHGVPTDKKIEKGDFVTMDFGAVVNGYRSDMTRTVCVGAASNEQREVYEAVLNAQKLAFEQIKPGVKCLDVDRAARDYIDKSYSGCFGHGLGHSVGLEIHEDPAFNTRCDTELKPGMVLTVEPGIYIAGKFGVRIEDMIVVTENGYDNITKSPKGLIEL